MQSTKKGGVNEMTELYKAKNVRPEGYYVYCRYIVKNGKRIYPKKSKVFRFWIDR